MNNKHQVHNLIILDESGSMESIRKPIIQGFNEIVQTMKGIEIQFPDQEHYITMISFNGLKQKLMHVMDPVGKLELINDVSYNPEASTPLYDAMGASLSKLRQLLKNQTNYNVLVTILTDGEENDSKEYSGIQIKKMVEELKANRWTFTYIGADHNVDKFAISLSITNFMSFDKNEEGIKKMFGHEKFSRVMYSMNIREDKDTKDDFYKKDK